MTEFGKLKQKLTCKACPSQRLAGLRERLCLRCARFNDEGRHAARASNTQHTCCRRCLYDHKQHRQQQRRPPGRSSTCVAFHDSVSNSRSYQGARLPRTPKQKAQNKLRRFNFRKRPPSKSLRSQSLHPFDATNDEVTIQRLLKSQIRDTRWTPVALPDEDLQRHVLALRLRQRAFSRASACPQDDWSKNFEPSEDAVAIKPQQISNKVAVTGS